jgi:hypothetical protein
MSPCKSFRFSSRRERVRGSRHKLVEWIANNVTAESEARHDRQSARAKKPRRRIHVREVVRVLGHPARLCAEPRSPSGDVPAKHREPTPIMQRVEEAFRVGAVLHKEV